MTPHLPSNRSGTDTRGFGLPSGLESRADTAARQAPPEVASAGLRQRAAEPRGRVQGPKAEPQPARTTLESAMDHAVVTMNPGGQTPGWNADARLILGYADAEIPGRSGEVFFSVEDRVADAFVAELCRAIKDGRAANGCRHLRRDGGRFWTSRFVMPLPFALNEATDDAAPFVSSLTLAGSGSSGAGEARL